jgi:uncharacterized protein (TIGR02466 family)
MNVDKEQLWATPYFYSIEKINFEVDIVKWILEKSKKELSVFKSNVGGWQSNIQNNKTELSPLISYINSFCKNINLGIQQIDIPEIWINVNKKNDWNTIHQHGGYTFSGVYYVKTPKDCGRLAFRDPRPGAISNSFLVDRYDNGELRYVNIKEGLFLLFPSYLEHFVEPNNSKEERISMSFNLNVI